MTPDVRLLIGPRPARYPSDEEFSRWEVPSGVDGRSASGRRRREPFGLASQSSGDDGRKSLIGELHEALRESLDGDGIVSPVETHLVAASRA